MGLDVGGLAWVTQEEQACARVHIDTYKQLYDVYQYTHIHTHARAFLTSAFYDRETASIWQCGARPTLMLYFR